MAPRLIGGGAIVAITTALRIPSLCKRLVRSQSLWQARGEAATLRMAGSRGNASPLLRRGAHILDKKPSRLIGGGLELHASLNGQI